MNDLEKPGRLPPLNSLRAFEAAARRGSATAAAHELGVTHSAVSHQIRALEAALGVPVFERGGRRLTLTPQGALLLPAVSRAFSEIAATAAQMQRPEAKGRLGVACVAGLLSFWILPRLGGFTEQHPGVTLDFTMGNDPSRIADPDVDVAILYARAEIPGEWCRLWSRLRLFPVVAPGLLVSRPLRTVRDLSDHVLVHGDNGDEWTTWLTAADALALPRGRQHFFSDARLSTEAALHGQGVALGDTITAATLIARGDLTVPFDLSVPATDSFWVACRREMRSAPMVAAFIDWLFSTLDTNALPEPEVSARTRLRSRPAGPNADEAEVAVADPLDTESKPRFLP